MLLRATVYYVRYIRIHTQKGVSTRVEREKNDDDDYYQDSGLDIHKDSRAIVEGKGHGLSPRFFSQLKKTKKKKKKKRVEESVDLAIEC